MQWAGDTVTGSGKKSVQGHAERERFLLFLHQTVSVHLFVFECHFVPERQVG